MQKLISLLAIFSLMFYNIKAQEEGKLNFMNHDLYSVYVGGDIAYSHSPINKMGSVWSSGNGFISSGCAGFSILYKNRYGIEGGGSYNFISHRYLHQFSTFNSNMTAYEFNLKMRIDFGRNEIEDAKYVKFGAGQLLQPVLLEGKLEPTANTKYTTESITVAVLYGEIGLQNRSEKSFVDIGVVFRYALENFYEIELDHLSTPVNGIATAKINGTFIGLSLRYHFIVYTRHRDNITAPLIPKSHI